MSNAETFCTMMLCPWKSPIKDPPQLWCSGNVLFRSHDKQAGGLKGFLRAKISMTNTRVLSECIGHLVNDYRNKRKKIIQFHIRKQPRSKERLKREKGIGCIIKSVGEKRRKSQIDLASSETYKTTTEEITQKNNIKQVRDEAHTKVQARKDIIPDKYHERKENQNKDDVLWERITWICKQDSKEVVNG